MDNDHPTPPGVRDVLPDMTQAEILGAYEEDRATVADLRDGNAPSGHVGLPSPDQLDGDVHRPLTRDILFDHDHELFDQDEAVTRAVDGFRIPPV